MSEPRKILMVAKDYPPRGSAGAQRVLKFTEHLPAFGWSPLVLSVSDRLYRDSAGSDLPIPEHVKPVLYRAWALDSKRHLAVKGRTLQWLVTPDRYWTWIVDGVRKGARIVRQHSPQFIWSTFPVSTAHWIGYKLSRRFGLPWIADYRDPMFQDHAARASQASLRRTIDEYAVGSAAALIFATNRMKYLYEETYPGLESSRTFVVENGFDETSMDRAEDAIRTATARERRSSGPAGSIKKDFVLLHNGYIYPDGRNPVPLFEALRSYLDKRGREDPGIRLVLTGLEESDYEQDIKRLRLGGNVELTPSVPYERALEAAFEADGLLVLQGWTFDAQVPSKVYEYLRTGKPILAVTGPHGATSELLSSVPRAVVVSDGDVGEIESGLKRLVRVRPTENPNVGHYGRFQRARELAAILEQLLSEGLRSP